MNLERIKYYSHKRKIPISAIAKEIGFSKPGLYMTIKNNTLPAAHLEKIIKILNIPIWELFSIDPSAEIDELKQQIQNQMALIDYLSSREKDLEKTMEDEIKLRDGIIKKQKELIEKLTKR